MIDKTPGKVPVTFAKGLLDDVAELTAITPEDDQARKDEADAIKRSVNSTSIASGSSFRRTRSGRWKPL